MDEKPRRLKRGKQIIGTPDGYVFPLDIINGLAYLRLRPFTNDEWKVPGPTHKRGEHSGIRGIIRRA